MWHFIALRRDVLGQRRQVRVDVLAARYEVVAQFEIAKDPNVPSSCSVAVWLAPTLSAEANQGPQLRPVGVAPALTEIARIGHGRIGDPPDGARVTQPDVLPEGLHDEVRWTVDEIIQSREGAD
jgi:hypothetical protein